MSMNDKSLVEVIDTALHNPVEIFLDTMEYLRRGIDGKFDIVDPSNPFVFLMEASCQHTAGSVRAFESEIRKLFPIVADEPMDLYHHITDKNNLGLFALAAKARMSFVFLESELRSKMIQDPDNNYRKIVIPANTQVDVGGYPFTLPYPVEIRELEHKHIQVVYDTTVKHPLYSLSTNVIDPVYSSTSTDREISIGIQFHQYEIKSLRETVSPGLSLDITTTTVDKFLYCRVWVRNQNNKWVEIRTTHSNYYYDPTTPTAMIKVLGDELRVSIPDYYIQTGMVVGEVRADFYITKGDVLVDLASFEPYEFKVAHKPLDRSDPTPYSEALKLVTSRQLFSSTLVSGGRDPLTFEEVRRRVIYNITGDREQPISPDEIEKNLMDRGYSITKRIDTLTNRLFLASRTLPAPRHPKLITAAGLGMQTIVFSATEAQASESVIDNGTSFTIDPKTYFKLSGGVARFVSQSLVNSILTLPQDQRVLELNRQNLFSTPYHYVVDLSEPDDVDVRAYHLTRPVAENKLFIGENSKTMMSCSVGGYAIDYKEDGFTITVSTNSDENVKALTDGTLHAQLAVKPTGQTEYVYINGTLQGRSETGESVFTFDIKSNFNVTKNGLIELMNFTSSSATPRVHRVSLHHAFDVIFATSTTMGGSWSPGVIDNNLGRHLLPSRIAAIGQEQITFRLGYDLKSLWTQSRVIAGQAKYETYPADVYDYYTENQIQIVETPGQEPTFIVTHAKGEQKFNPDNTPVILHRKGEVKTVNGVPVLRDPRQINHQVDIMMMESAYRFSNDEAAQIYKDEVVDLITSWITGTLADIDPNLLEETRIFFYPETRSGLIRVIFDNGIETEINAAQTLVVNLYVDKSVERDVELREQLRTKGTAEINEYFGNRVIGAGAIVELLRKLYRDTVIEVDVVGLGGGSNDFKVMTIQEQTDRLGIGKRLVSRPDGKVLVEEDIQFNFIRHRGDTTERNI